MFKITDYIHIRKDKIFNRKELVCSSNTTLYVNEFLKYCYNDLGVSYPKFHKMDTLSKLGILGTELLFKNRNIPGDTALVFSNSASSIETDKVHLAGMANIVSPAVFVYTLPNIVLGEISIKYALQSENAFFISRKFDADLLFEYSEILLKSSKASNVVCGWIEWINDEYDVFLCLISREGELEFSRKTLEELYNFENE